MFKFNNKDTRMTSMTLLWCLYCKRWIYVAVFSSVHIVDFEQSIVFWVAEISQLSWKADKSVAAIARGRGK